MASSNDSLYGLAAHLQSMENTITDFIFHCALRLSAMTDAQVFMLMKSPNNVDGSRRFCGSPELVEEFGKNGLSFHAETDIEMELDPDHLPLRQKPQLQLYQPQQKQQHPTQRSPTTIVGTKRRGHTASEDPTKKIRRDSDCQKIECKTEIEEFYVDSDSNDGDGFGHRRTTSNYEDSASNLDASSAVSDGDVFNEYADSSSVDNDEEDVPSRRIGMDVPSLVQKELAVAQITEPARAFVRGTTENKLLASVCYDAGKAITLNNPHPVDSPFFRDHCKERILAYVEQFPDFVRVPVTPHLSALFKRDVADMLEYSPEAFMKMNARNGQKRAAQAMRRSGDSAS